MRNPILSPETIWKMRATVTATANTNMEMMMILSPSPSSEEEEEDGQQQRPVFLKLNFKVIMTLFFLGRHIPHLFPPPLLSGVVSS